MSKSDLTPTTVLAYDNPHNHADQGINVLFGDYHVEWVPGPEVNRIVSQHRASEDRGPRANSSKDR